MKDNDLKFIESVGRSQTLRDSYIVSDFIEREKIDEWLKNEVYPAAIEYQKSVLKKPTETLLAAWERGIPLIIPMGGGLYVTFSHTTAMRCIRVKFEFSGFSMEKDFTDWENF